MSATFVPRPNIAVAQPDAQTQLAALLEGVGVAPLTDTGWIRVTGEDRVRWLNGMTTNSIQELKPGEGNYNFFLSAQGRILADAYAFAHPESILLETDRKRLPALMELLDRFIIMDDVELADLSGSRFGLFCAGPEAAGLLAEIGIEVESGSVLSSSTAMWRGNELNLLVAYSPLVPRFEIWADARESIAVLCNALTSASAAMCGSDALEQLRILEGTPRYGRDIRDRELPQETAQTRALHFSKGCYLGQEIVERIRSRGNVHRTFHAFELTGNLPAPGAVLETDAKPVGELTSVAAIPLASGLVQLALGYIRREVLERGSVVTYPGCQAKPIKSPYSRHTVSRI